MAARSGGLAVALLACAAATLAHHIHNAEYLSDYPNLPASLTRGGVYAAWLGEALFGAFGYLLFAKGWTRTGLLLLGIYALYAFGGLAHYYLAPPGAHSLAMNATIWGEAITGALLLAAVARRIAG